MVNSGVIDTYHCAIHTGRGGRYLSELVRMIPREPSDIQDGILLSPRRWVKVATTLEIGILL